MKVANVFRSIPAELPDELNEPLLTAEALRIERIVSRGQISPPGFWYDQSENEWILVLSGGARLEFENSGQILGLETGDSLLIPAHVRHRVDWTDPDAATIWLAVFYS